MERPRRGCGIISTVRRGAIGHDFANPFTFPIRIPRCSSPRLPAAHRKGTPERPPNKYAVEAAPTRAASRPPSRRRPPGSSAGGSARRSRSRRRRARATSPRRSRPTATRRRASSPSASSSSRAITSAPPGSRLHAGLRAWVDACPRPLVLFFDEIDALQGESLRSILRQLRAGFPDRPKGFPWSAARLPAKVSGRDRCRTARS